MNSKHEQLWKRLSDPDFRRQFINAHVDEGIAFQIRSLRINNKKQTQPELAQELGVRQPLVSSWENPAYGKYSLNTLKKLAKAFDVGLLVRFVPFSTLVDRTINLTTDVIAPPSFGKEEHYHVAASASTASSPVVDANKDFFLITDVLMPSIYASTAEIYASTAKTEKELVHEHA